MKTLKRYRIASGPFPHDVRNVEPCPDGMFHYHEDVAAMVESLKKSERTFWTAMFQERLAGARKSLTFWRSFSASLALINLCLFIYFL